MTRFEILGFLGSVSDADAKDLASRFGISEGAVYSRLTILNRQGLVRKTRGEDGLLRFSLTDWGREKLEYLEEKFDESEEENLKSNSGGKKMPRVEILNGKYECPECGGTWVLEDVPEDSDDAYCDECDCLLEASEDNAEGTEEEDEEFEPVKRRR